MFTYIKQYLGNVCEKVNFDAHNILSSAVLIILSFQISKRNQDIR